MLDDCGCEQVNRVEQMATVELLRQFTKFLDGSP